ncbi:hypothetical protein [Novosphingobium sp. TCA1]|uniref:hypothetical protein n=1 Tax=Novosphingobium sp. TCA1 TaxID=2682474 RepID=UPI00135C4C71|nr:hypothetical protein [Novosphingobium sp. TCA1]
MDSKENYPGSCASVGQLLDLAEEYHAAHNRLVTNPNSGLPHASAPARLLAIHAIELYLNAYLLHNGVSQQIVRGLQHDLSKRTVLAIEHGLNLRKRTEAHLMKLHAAREYLSARYGPDLAETWSEMSSLAATLQDVFKKVRSSLHGRLYQN